MESVTETVHISFSGETITRIARDALLSEMPSEAFRIIQSGLIGKGSADAAIKVLSGTHDLVGDSNEFRLVKAEQNEELRKFKKDFSYIYAGRYKDGRGWRRPKAIVTGFNEKDARFASKRHTMKWPDSPCVNPEWTKARVEFYCSEGETVEFMNHPAIGKQCVIWEPCGEMPHWLRPHMNKEAALTDFLKFQSLEKRHPISEPVYDPEIDSRSWTDTYFDRDLEEDEEMLEEMYEREDQLRRERHEEIGRRVMAQAGDDTFILTLGDGTQVTVPRAPFVRWALRRTDYADQAPEWVNVSTSGMKMTNDDPNHTDWMLGAGLNLDDAYDDNVRKPAYKEYFRIQEEHLMPEEKFSGIRAAMEMLSETIHKCAVLSDAGIVEGVVGKDIAVFPDSKPERATKLQGIKGVIVAKGGQLAHFAIVSREQGITVMAHPDACELFEDGLAIKLNPKTGRVIILEKES